MEPKDNHEADLQQAQKLRTKKRFLLDSQDVPAEAVADEVPVEDAPIGSTPAAVAPATEANRTAPLDEEACRLVLQCGLDLSAMTRLGFSRVNDFRTLAEWAQTQEHNVPLILDGKVVPVVDLNRAFDDLDLAAVIAYFAKTAESAKPPALPAHVDIDLVNSASDDDRLRPLWTVPTFSDDEADGSSPPMLCSRSPSPLRFLADMSEGAFDLEAFCSERGDPGVSDERRRAAILRVVGRRGEREDDIRRWHSDSSPGSAVYEVACPGVVLGEGAPCPDCNCHGTLVLRTPKRLANGHQLEPFFGCSRYGTYDCKTLVTLAGVVKKCGSGQQTPLPPQEESHFSSSIFIKDFDGPSPLKLDEDGIKDEPVLSMGQNRHLFHFKGGRISRPAKPLLGDTWSSYGSCRFASQTGCPARARKDYRFGREGWEEYFFKEYGGAHSGHPLVMPVAEMTSAQEQELERMCSEGRTEAQIVHHFEVAAHKGGRVDPDAFVPTKAQIKHAQYKTRATRGEATDQLNRMNEVNEVTIKRSGSPCLSVVVKTESLLATVLKRVDGGKILFLDGTSGISPRGTQVVVALMRVDDGTDVPVAYQVSSGHAEADYSLLIASLVRSGMAPDAVMMDFELAERNAVAQFWPNAAVRHCSFHLLQAVIRKWREMYGRRSSEGENETVSFVRQLINCRSDGDFLSILTTFSAFLTKGKRFNEFERYFVAQWIDKVPPHTWSLIRETHPLVVAVRTNNSAERHNWFLKHVVCNASRNLTIVHTCEKLGESLKAFEVRLSKKQVNAPMALPSGGFSLQARFEAALKEHGVADVEPVEDIGRIVPAMLAKRGLELVHTEKMGACLFEAFGIGIGLGQGAQRQVRAACVRELRSNVQLREIIEPNLDAAVEGTYPEFLDKLSQYSFYGGNEALVALTTHYNVTAIVIELDGTVQEVRPFGERVTERTIVLIHTPDRPGESPHYYGTRAIISSEDPIKRRLQEADKPRGVTKIAASDEKKAKAAQKARETRKRHRENEVLARELLHQKAAATSVAPPMPGNVPVPIAGMPSYAELAATVAQLQATAASTMSAAKIPPLPALKPVAVLAQSVEPALCGSCGKRVMVRGVMVCGTCNVSYHNKCATPVPNAAEKRKDRPWTCRACRR